MSTTCPTEPASNIPDQELFSDKNDLRRLYQHEGRLMAHEGRISIMEKTIGEMRKEMKAEGAAMRAEIRTNFHILLGVMIALFTSSLFLEGIKFILHK